MLAVEDIIIEYVYVEAYVKVSAVHVPTNIEISIVGDGGLPQDCLNQVAIRKLTKAIEKHRG